MSDNYLVILVFALILATLFAGWGALALGSARHRLISRATAIRDRVKNDPVKRTTLTLRLNLADTKLDSMAARLLPNPAHWRRQLERTGTDWSLGGFGIFALTIATVAGGAAYVAGLSQIIIWPIALGSGYYVPRFVINWAINRRAKKFLALFPDAIGLMVRGLRAGLPVTETIITVGREVHGPTGEEFRKIADQIQLGQSVDEILWQAAGRIEQPEFTFMVISFGIQRETGGNLAETLDNLDQLLRRRRQIKLKIKAFSSEARASSGIIGSLPFVILGILSVVNWNYIQSLFTTSSGHMLLGIAAALLATGVVTLKKMARFEI